MPSCSSTASKDASCESVRWRHIPFDPTGLFWNLPQNPTSCPGPARLFFGTVLPTSLDFLLPSLQFLESFSLPLQILLSTLIVEPFFLRLWEGDRESNFLEHMERKSSGPCWPISVRLVARSSVLDLMVVVFFEGYVWIALCVLVCFRVVSCYFGLCFCLLRVDVGCLPVFFFALRSFIGLSRPLLFFMFTLFSSPSHFTFLVVKC